MSDSTFDSTQLSKRAARRLIQRAFVLAGRDRNVRQHIRSARLITLWAIEDWGLTWSVSLEKGKVEFERRPAKKPDAALSWPTAEEFFTEIERGAHGVRTPEEAADPGARKFIEPLYQAFRAALCELLRNPVDEDGEPLA